MEFRDDVLVDRELEIACYLRRELSMERIVEQTGLNRKIVRGHVRNMLEKLNVESTANLIKILQTSTSENPLGLQAPEWEAAQTKIRQAGDLYFASIQPAKADDARSNVFFTGIALLAGIASVLLVCDCIVKLFMSSGCLQDLQLFAR